MFSARNLLLGSFGCCLAMTLVAQGKPGRRSADDPSGRAKANAEWFGTVTPAYLDHKAKVAQQEVLRWNRSFATPGLLAQGRAAALQTAAGPNAGAAASTWVNLGPFSDAAAGRNVDAGRPASIVALANQVLLMATSGGGVFRCSNADPASTADWIWEPVTDSLPASSASGNVAVGDLAASPDGLTLFLGLGDDFDATGRGVYRSSNRGDTWTAATLAANNATRIYSILPLGSGPAAVVLLGSDDGLMRSVDGGASFSKVTGPLGNGRVQCLKSLSATELIASRQDPAPPEGTGVGALYWSADAGATWTQAAVDSKVAALATGDRALGRMTLATSAASQTRAWGITQVYSPSGSGTAGNVVAQGLLSSTDKGHSWTFVAPDNPTASGTLFKGTGQSMSSDGTQGWYNQMLAVSPTDPARLVTGANLATYRTLDGGLTWNQLTEWTGTGHPYSHADNQCHGWSPDNQTLYVGTDGGLTVFKNPWASTIPVSDDATFVDNARNKGMATHLVYHLGSTLAGNTSDGRWRIALGCQDNGTLIRQGSGAALQASGDFAERLGGDGFATLYHPVDANQALASYYNGNIYRSTNGGASFKASASGLVESGDDDRSPFATRIVLGLADPTGNSVYTFSNGTVYRSPDFGQNWTALGRTGLPVAGANATGETAAVLYLRGLGTAKSNSAVVGLVANGGRVYLTNDAGGSWAQAGALPGSNKSLSSISFDPLDARTLYVASVAPDSAAHHLWKSVDGGASFTSLDGTATAGNGLPWGIPVHIVVPDPKVARQVYVGTDFGVYRSADGGASWSRLGTGLPLVATRDLYVAPDGSFLRAATFGRGVWELALAAAVQVSFSSGGPGTLAPAATGSYSATVTGFTSNSSVNWSDGGAGGRFNPVSTASGVATSYTAPAAPALVTLTATSAELPAATSTLVVPVYDPATLAVTVTPAQRALVTGATASFQATVTGGPSAAVTWSASAGSITAAGLFTAPATAQTVTLTATSAYAGPGNRATATAVVKTLDLNGNGSVGLEDLALLAYAYGTVNPGAKLTDGTTVDDADLAAFLSKY